MAHIYFFKVIVTHTRWRLLTTVYLLLFEISDHFLKIENELNKKLLDVHMHVLSVSVYVGNVQGTGATHQFFAISV